MRRYQISLGSAMPIMISQTPRGGGGNNISTLIIYAREQLSLKISQRAEICNIMELYLLHLILKVFLAGIRALSGVCEIVNRGDC